MALAEVDYLNGGGSPAEYPIPATLTHYNYMSQTFTGDSVPAYFECNSATNYAWIVYSTSAVDLSDYSKIVLEGRLLTYCSGGSFTQGIQVGITDTTPNTGNESDYVLKRPMNTTGDFKIELDVSSVSGSKYIKLCCFTSINKGYLDKLYLLK